MKLIISVVIITILVLLVLEQVKVLALKLAELMEFLRNREAESDKLQNEIQDTFKELNKSEEYIIIRPKHTQPTTHTHLPILF